MGILNGKNNKRVKITSISRLIIITILFFAFFIIVTFEKDV